MRYFYILIIGVMLGYAWCMYHHKGYPQTVINYPDIAIDTTAPPHKISRKYLTQR